MAASEASRPAVLTKANVIAAAAIAAVVIAAFALLFNSLFGAPAQASGLRAVIHDADGVAREMPLDEDASVVIASSAGANTVTVRDGSVFMEEADCDGQDCIHQGAISAPGKQIICLPHKLWVEVVADGGAEGELDVSAVAGGADGGLDTVTR